MIRFEKNKFIDELTSFGVKAETYKYYKIDELSYLLTILRSNKLPIRILGGGSNILWTKKFNGLTLHINTKGILITKENDSHVFVDVQAGENWHEFVLWSIKNNYGGIENLALIPGSVGASPIQNIGAYGVELKETFESCRAISISNGSLRVFKNKECNFNYRSSIFKNDLKNKYIITNVTFKLTKKNHNIKCNYEPLKIDLMLNNIKFPTIKDISNSVIKIRSKKLPDPKKIGNCGSFFKNPIINKFLFKKIKDKDKTIPYYFISKSEIKIPAAWLIEKCGFKGFREGNTGTHEKHALIIINNGKATGQEIYNFSQKIKNSVLKKFNILLKEEVNIIYN